MTNNNVPPAEPGGSAANQPPKAEPASNPEPPAKAASPAKVEPSREERFLAAVAHLCIAPVISAVVGPLVIWVTERGNANWSDYVMHNAKQALVYQGLIATIVAVLLLTGVLKVLGFILAFFAVIYGIAAALDTYAGHKFEYFWIGKFIKEL